ncbi:MAG: hypothetical protein ABIA12_02750 [Candidatus Aenigmatarchaeota archaeon]
MSTQAEFWKPFFELLGVPFRRKIALVLYSNGYLCEHGLDGVKDAGISVRRMSKIMAETPEKTRYHMDKLADEGLAEKYAGLVGNMPVALYKASGRFSKTIESLGVGKGLDEYYKNRQDG